MLRIIMDGAGDMPEAWGDQFDIQVIPINIHFGEKTFLQKVDLSDKDFYRMARESGSVPKTSQPTPQQFIDFYQRIAQPGDTILSLHVTSKLSGTFDSAVMAAKELAGKFNVLPFDSACGSAGIGFMAREARLLERAGAQMDAIMQRLEQMRSTTRILLTLDTLEYARMSGRVKTLQAALASVLNIKPIVALKDGVLDMADRVRTRNRALDFILEKMAEEMGKNPVLVAVVHAQDPESGQKLLERIREHLNCSELILTGLSISVAANLGPGTVGIVATPVQG